MKKILSILLMLCMVCSVFAACTELQTEGPALEDAVEYLKSMYKSDEGKTTPADYSLVAQVPIDGVKFTVTWTVDNENIKIVAENGLYTVKLPASNAEEITYTLTATVADAAGKTESIKMTRKLPAYDKSTSVTAPEEGAIYKLFLVQANIGKTVFATQEMSGTKYIKTTTDPKAGAEFQIEKADGGIKIYTMISGVKNYVYAYTTTADDGKVSKYIGFSTDKSSVYTYHSDVNAWFTTIDKVDYVVGTYNTFDTICISESTYISADNTGVSQFPLEFMTKETADNFEQEEGPADPTELTAIPKFVEIANKLEDKGAPTIEKYLVKGTITNIVKEDYGNMYIKDAEGNELYIYGLYSKDGSTRYDKLENKPQVGDTITVMGVACNYNGPQMKNAWLMELEATPHVHSYSGDCDAICNTCEEAREATGTHTYSGACVAECSVCGEARTELGEHTYAAPCVAKCSVCEKTRTELGAHTYANDCVAKCTFCDNERTDAPHVWTNACDEVCDGEGCTFTRTAGCKDENGDDKCDICSSNMKTPEEIAAEHVAAVKDALAWDITSIELDGEYQLPTNTSFSDVTITWVSSDASVVVGTNGKITVTLGDAEKEVTLTATIKSGETEATKEFKITVAQKSIFEFNITNEPVADTAYKGYLLQVTSNKKLYLDGKVSGRYLSTTEVLHDAVSVYAEKSGDGYKFYIVVDGANKYIEVYNNNEDNLSVQYSDNASVFTYDATTNAWVTSLDETDYYLGTYKTFNTISASKTSFINAENTGVDQFPLEFASYICTHKYAGVCASTCVNCGYVRENVSEHTWTNACDTECDGCGETRTAPHVYEFPCSTTCKACSAPVIPGDHVDADSDNVCDNCKVAIPATETIELDFVTTFGTYAADWAPGYTTHEIAFTAVGGTTDGKVILSNANKQTSTITDRPVICAKKTAQYVTIDLGSSAKNIVSVEFDLLQWTNKEFEDIHIECTTDGTTWTSCSEVIKTPGALASTALPEGVISVRLSFVSSADKNTQIGLSGITLIIG